MQSERRYSFWGTVAKDARSVRFVLFAKIIPRLLLIIVPFTISLAVFFIYRETLFSEASLDILLPIGIIFGLSSMIAFLTTRCMPKNFPGNSEVIFESSGMVYVNDFKNGLTIGEERSRVNVTFSYYSGHMGKGHQKNYVFRGKIQGNSYVLFRTWERKSAEKVCAWLEEMEYSVQREEGLK